MHAKPLNLSTLNSVNLSTLNSVKIAIFSSGRLSLVSPKLQQASAYYLVSDLFEDIKFLCLCTPNTGTLSGLGWWRVVRFLISLSQMIGNGCDQVLDHEPLNNLNVRALGPPPSGHTD